MGIPSPRGRQLPGQSASIFHCVSTSERNCPSTPAEFCAEGYSPGVKIAFVEQSLCAIHISLWGINGPIGQIYVKAENDFPTLPFSGIGRRKARNRRFSPRARGQYHGQFPQISQQIPRESPRGAVSYPPAASRGKSNGDSPGKFAALTPNPMGGGPSREASREGFYQPAASIQLPGQQTG